MDLKAAYESLSDPDVTKRDYDAAKAALSQQAADIWRYICKQSHRTLGWDLASEIGPEVVAMQGDYSEFVTEVDYETYENSHYKYVEGFPTELLWAAEWQAIVDKHIADAIEKFTVERRDKLAKNKIKKQAKIVRQKETRKQNGELQTAILEKSKAVLTEEEYTFLVQNLFSRRSMADTIPTRIFVNGQEMTLDAAPRFTCIVHQQGIRVNIPEFVEINSRNTIECMEKMSQRAWEHISTGQLFQVLFREIFPEEDCSVPIPATIAELNAGDFGVVHAAGMITLGCEAIFEGKTKLFFRTPEDHLHPKAERRIIGMFIKMQELLAPDEEAGVATAEAPDEDGDEDGDEDAIESEQKDT